MVHLAWSLSSYYWDLLTTQKRTGRPPSLRWCALIATFYVDAYGRLPDVVRSRSLPGWLSRFSSGKNKAIPNTRARHTEQTPGEQCGGDKQAGSESDPDTDGS